MSTSTTKTTQERWGFSQGFCRGPCSWAKEQCHQSEGRNLKVKLRGPIEKPQWISSPPTRLSFQYGPGFHLSKGCYFSKENIIHRAQADVGSPLGSPRPGAAPLPDPVRAAETFPRLLSANPWSTPVNGGGTPVLFREGPQARCR